MKMFKHFINSILGFATLVFSTYIQGSSRTCTSQPCDWHIYILTISKEDIQLETIYSHTTTYGPIT